MNDPYAEQLLEAAGFGPQRQLAPSVWLVERATDGEPRVAMGLRGDFSLKTSFIRTIAPAWSRLGHPGVVRLEQIVEDHPQFVIREYVRGKDLGALIHDGDVPRALPLDLVIHLGVAVCEALAALHESVGIHGALAPHHLLASVDGAVRLIGIEARHQEVLMATSRAGVYMPRYYAWLSPECCRGEQEEPRGDLFSLGVCLWEWSTGRRLFSRQSALETVWAVVEQEIPNAALFRADLPEDLLRVIERAVRRDPEKRYQNVAELQQALHGCLRCAPDLSRHALAALVNQGAERIG